MQIGEALKEINKLAKIAKDAMEKAESTGNEKLEDQYYGELQGLMKAFDIISRLET